jgi:spore coat protein SA
MRIGLICTEKLPVPPIRGGAIQTYISGVLPFLCQTHDVTVVCRTDPALPDREEAGGCRFARVEAGTPEIYRDAVARFLAAEAPFDALIVYNRPAFVPHLMAAAPGAPRFFLSLHNDMLAPDRLEPSAGRAVLERVQGVLCISDYIRRTIDGQHPGFQEKLHTVRSGVDLAGFRPAWTVTEAERAALRQSLGLRAGDPVVLHVSRLSRRKGNDLLVQAMVRLRQTRPGVQLLVVGSSRYGSNDLDRFGQAVRANARRLLGADAVFTGFVPPARVAGLFATGDLFVCASQWEEPLARVHYEAMAAGLPIVTTDRGGNAEVIEEGGNGLIARPHDDPAAFAACMEQLLADAALRERLGRRGRALAVERYPFRRVAAELLTVLEGR